MNYLTALIMALVILVPPVTSVAEDAARGVNQVAQYKQKQQYEQAPGAVDLTTILPPSFGPHSARAEFAARLNRIQFDGYADWRYPTETERALLDAAGIVQPKPPSKADWSPDQVLSGTLPGLRYVTGWIVAHHWSTLHGGYVRSIAAHQVFAVRNHPD